ncbi:phytanoyl-CoA dioxygenase family protein [Janthinobacterium lividum]|uniref:Phytanoyl-CoA dioxygenase family protein n=1 Tax=Janthinobacterium lividum TaxID=29581 RepID=A0ABU0XN62_9BURK|nr:phytanoyl-CoA dioxygenase family protein [Janthinobacterium lividum]MDQ4624963.1 phytanoyl-CoA dioxygenase family protein [Janthinobacterium lividum]MDQ4673434.1 phytanoyl-CoA dioxygenase family protein [Janthinobacterium lividum]MDQ4684164.1 phytanoyl-CoA dioxygenase family protein [Janthinobacterium lividum]
MPTTNAGAAPPSPFWLSQQDCRLDDFILTVSQRTALADYPHAASVDANILVYDCDAVRALAASAASLRALQAEWGKALMDGPGVIVLQRAVDDKATLEQVSGVFRALIAEQHASGQAGGDHFAKPGANDRIWNAQQKLCLRAPEAFARYYANPVFAWIAEAWLGPAYQVTAQVNVVNPGGAAQAPHRDYHLGFQSAASCAAYPAPVHQMSALLTLQGAVAHCDMPLESGPTLYLPYSQRYPAGFLAWQQQPFRDYFAQHCVQLPLSQGDAVFFNPALFHAAGHNRSSDIRRMANLLQVSSPFGRAMEALDRRAMSAALYPALQALRAQGDLDELGASHAIAACAEGYAFPSNLDRDQPIGGMAPPTQQQLMHEALAQHWPAARFLDALDSHAWRQQA